MLKYNMKKKIVFVFNDIITRCIKRVEEFIEYGYEVDVYAFNRGHDVYVKSNNFEINLIGKHDVSMSYFSRAVVIRESLQKLFHKYKNDDVVYYFFFFDVASIGHMFCKKNYIYEESDLPYTHISNHMIRSLMAKIDRRIIRKSLLTIMTSEGFVEFHYGKRKPENIIVVPNRVNERLNQYLYKETPLDINHLRFSFVGGFRYLSTFNFIKYGSKYFPQHTFSVYGNIMRFKQEIEELALNNKNVLLYGLFKNPEDLPGIYANTDIVLANYDATSINAQYAEPNKMYESIFFHTPILVSSGTFLSRKVSRLGVGYDIDSNKENEVVAFIKGLTENDIIEKQSNSKAIPKEYSVNKNPLLFQYLSDKI